MKAVLTILCLSRLGHSSVDYRDVLPESYAAGNAITLSANQPYDPTSTLTLSPSTPILTLDYRTEKAGFPFLEISSLSAPAQIEVKYAEAFVALENPYSDGPWTFGNELANTFRTETFNITRTGRLESYFVQGGQRWETIRLLTNSSVTFSKIGFRATADHTAVESLPGKFSSSDDVYNQIWNLGARVVQVACVDAGNAPSTWEITPDDGAFIRGQQTAQSANGTGFSNYTLSFMTKIVRGGTGWRVASGVTPYGALFYLTSDYPEDNTFVNVNRTLLPPNSLVYNYGYSIVNQSTLTTGWNEYFPVNFTVEEGVWHNISTTISPSGYRVSLNGTELATVSFEQANLLAGTSRSGSGSPTAGTWGFGPWNGQEAYIKSVLITAPNGTTLYSNPMTSPSTLAEYGVAPLSTSVCMDGAKRDRLVWIGDFYHTQRIIAATTDRKDFILGTIDYVFSFQKETQPNRGFVPISLPLGTRPEHSAAFANLYSGLIDYQDLFLNAIGNYFWSSGDSVGLEPFWPKIKTLVSARMEYIDPYSGLIAGEDAFYFLGPVNGTTVTALFAQTLRSLIPLAEAYNDFATAAQYASIAVNLSGAINEKLWNEEIGTYSLSLSSPSNFSVSDIAWSLLSNTANSTQAHRILSTALPSLKLGTGYKSTSSTPSDSTTQLSPNILGMLLPALFHSHRHHATSLTPAKFLLETFWPAMTSRKQYTSGAAWEYLYPDGTPGIDLFTSLAHPWGGAPTYVLTEWVLGIQATKPGFSQWEFVPLLGDGALGLKGVNGTVPTPRGSIVAGWEVQEEEAVVWVESVPEGTKGVLVLPEGVEMVDEDDRIGGREGWAKRQSGGVELAKGKVVRVRLS